MPAGSVTRGPEGLLHLDLVVDSSAGSPVTGLDASRFTLLDNGQPIRIVSFRAHSIASPPEHAVSVTLLVDTCQVSKEQEKFEYARAEAFLHHNGGHLAQPISLLVLNDSGLWRVSEPSADGDLLAERLARNRLRPWDDGNQTQRSAPAWNAYQAPGRVTPAILTQNPAFVALRMLARIAAKERRQPGRKLLVWVGPDWGTASGNNPGVPAESRPEKKDLFDQIVWLSGLLRLSRLSLCSVPVAGVQAPANAEPASAPPDFADIARAPATSPLNATPVALNRKVLALESGGSAPDPGSGDPVQLIGQCVLAPSAFYSLTFNPPPTRQFDDYHRLEVKLAGSDMMIRTATGYFDQPWYTDTPDPAVRRVTMAQLDQMLRGAGSLPDADLAFRLSNVELSERVDRPQIASWMAQLPGRKSREVLDALADASAFLDPPATVILTDAPPDTQTRQQILARAAAYLNDTIPRLPNFFAQRTSAEYEETPQFDRREGGFVAATPLRLVETSKTTVLYRNGAELETKPSHRETESPWHVVYGTFGPALRAVKGALANSASLNWARWEYDPAGGRRAVYRYAVSAVASQFQTGTCCLPGGDGNLGFMTVPGYHGEIAIDPATGAILRFEARADLTGLVPLDRSDLMISYGPVTIGNKTYICPLRSVNIMRSRSVATNAQWSLSYRDWAPFATKLIEFHYDHYHIFRANVRILPGDPAPDG